MARLAVILTAIAFVTATAVEALPEDVALLTDDECDASDETCSFNALQKRARKITAVATDAADTDDAAATAEVMDAERLAVDAGAKWYVGSAGQSCSVVCKGQHLQCSQQDLRTISTWEGVWKAAGGSCRMTWANDNRHEQGFAQSPLICNAAHCGSDSQGTCTYDAKAPATCDGLPAQGYSRICPCGAAGHSSKPSPSPLLPSPLPAPLPKPVGGHSSRPSHSSSCKALGLKEETGGTCSLFGCAKSRGPGAKCVKKKCVCKPGYCSSKKGVCVKQR